MRTRILKKESSLKALPLIAMLIGLLSMAQNCGAMEKSEEVPLSIAPTDKFLRDVIGRNPSDVVVPVDLAVIDIDVPIALITPLVSDEAVKGMKAMNDYLRYADIVACEAENTEPGIEFFQRILSQKICDNKEDIPDALLVRALAAGKETAALQVYLNENKSHIQSTIEKIKELKTQNEALKKALFMGRSKTAGINKQPVTDLLELEPEETSVVLGSGSQGFLKEDANLSEEFIEKNKSPIGDTEEINGSIGKKRQQELDLDEKLTVLKGEIEELLKQKEGLSKEKEGIIEKNKELMECLKQQEELNELIKKNKLEVSNLKKTLVDLEHEVKELLEYKKNLLREKEELTLENNARNINIDEEWIVTNIETLKTNAIEILKKKECLVLDPQIVMQMDALKREKTELSEQKDLISNTLANVRRQNQGLSEKNEKLVETNQHLSNIVSFLAWGGVACAVMTVSYIVLQRGK